MAHLDTYSVPANLFSVPDTRSESEIPQKSDVFLYSYHSPSVAKELVETAQALVYPRGKGIYATDETPDAIEGVLAAALGDEAAGKKWTAEEHRERRKRWREVAYTSVSNGKCSMC